VLSFAEPAVTGLDPDTGAQLWSRPDLAPSAAGAAVGELLLRREGDTLVAQRLADGTDVASFTLPANEQITGLAISGGRIFVTTPAHVLAIEPAA
jgi:hypothetical protein